MHINTCIYLLAVDPATTTFTSTAYLTPSPTTGPTSTAPNATPTPSITSECTCNGTSSAPGIYKMTLWITVLTLSSTILSTAVTLL